MASKKEKSFEERLLALETLVKDLALIPGFFINADVRCGDTDDFSGPAGDHPSFSIRNSLIGLIERTKSQRSQPGSDIFQEIPPIDP